MNPSDLVECILDVVRRKWYEHKPDEFHRDKRAIAKALLIYPYECEQRGWAPTCQDIAADLVKLVSRMDDTCKTYLPAYLAYFVRQHVGYHAEEIAAKSKRAEAVAARALKTLPTQCKTRNPTEQIEAMSQMFRALGRKPKRQRYEAEQLSLFPA